MSEKDPLEAALAEKRGTKMLEILEKLFKRPETRLDAQRMLGSLSSKGQAYARHLVVSGPSNNARTAAALAMPEEDVEAAAQELEKAIAALK